LLEGLHPKPIETVVGLFRCKLKVPELSKVAGELLPAETGHHALDLVSLCKE